MKFILNKIVFFVVLILAVLVVCVPVGIAVLNVFKSPPEFFSFPQSLLPRNISFSSLSPSAFFGVEHAVFNSFVVSLGAALTDIFVCVGAAYVLTRCKSKLVRVFNWLINFALVFTVGGSLFLRANIVVWVGMYDSYAGMFLPFTATALTVVIIRQYMKKTPDILYEMVRPDGAGHLFMFWHIFLPMAKPAMFTAGAVSFVLTFKRDMSHFYFSETLMPFSDFMSGITDNEGLLAALSLLSILLPLLIFVFVKPQIEMGE
ncbi:MAG: hypothetical protein FWH05_08195 [Oscillospiraceae bacterium]|nr:hypothetical protein [Oscillospiraceae bacterium]